MTNQPTNQLAEQKPQEQPLMILLKSDVVKERFIETVGQTGGAWITAIINAANLNPKIWECDPISVVTAGLNAAVLRLSVDPSTGQAAIVPFGKKATFIPMVRGIKQLALRTGKYRYINDAPIYEGEEVVEDRVSGLMTIEGRATSKTVIGYFASFALYEGYTSNLYMTLEEIENHAREFSPTFNRKSQTFYRSSMWLSNFDKMARKTVLRLLLLRDGILDDGSRNVLEEIDKDTGPTELEAELQDVIDGDVVEETNEPFNEGQALNDMGVFG